MSAVIGNGDTAQKLLNVIRRMEFCQNLRTAHYLTNLIHISADTSNIHRDNDFGAFRDSISQFIVIHLDIVLLRIHQDNGSTDMSDDRCRRRQYKYMPTESPL